MITPELILALGHRGMGHAKAQQWAAALSHAAERHGVNTPLRVAHFLAQVMHESMGLYYTREVWGPTAAQGRYERSFAHPWPRNAAEAKLPRFYRNRVAFRLGNTEPGDGKRFMGRGPIQATGRGNYRAAGRALGLDLEAHPGQLELPAAGAMFAGWFWQTRGLNALADQGGAGQVSAITLKVNGGHNGLPDRQARFGAAWAALAAQLPDAPDIIFISASGQEVPWNGQPTAFGSTLIDQALLENLRLLYPTGGGPWEYSPQLTVWRRNSGAFVLERRNP